MAQVESSEKFKNEAFPHLDSLWRTSLWLTRSEDKASLLVQQAYVSAYNEWSRAENHPDYRKLLFRSLSKQFLQHFAEENPPQRYAVSNNNNVNLDKTESPQLSTIPCHILGRVYAGLSPLIRLMVILSVCWGFAYREIAEMIGVEVDEVRSKIVMGRQQFKTLLIENFINAKNHGYQTIAAE